MCEYYGIHREYVLAAALRAVCCLRVRLVGPLPDGQP